MPSCLRTTMYRCLYFDETSHVILLGKFECNKKYKEKILKEIIAAICAMLNSNGGKVTIDFDTDGSIPVEGFPFSLASIVIRILEQSMISIIGLHQTITKINFGNVGESVTIFLEKADSLITNNYKLYLPSQTQVVEVSSLGPPENVKDIINREAIPNPVELGSHCQIFCKDKKCGFQESKVCQFKNLKADQSKRTTLADRMTGKGNKFTCFVSAFANFSGGHIYFGIGQDRIVEGEFIPNEKDKKEIIKKIEKVLNKMIWPEPIDQPKRGKHWEIFFEPVVDANSKPVPSTFVIVIYIAPCLGGVFTEEPECYEMVEGKITKISFTVWRNKISQPLWLQGKERIPHSLSRVTWSSPATQKTFTNISEKLRVLINDGNWYAISRLSESLQKLQPHSCEIKLVVLSKQATASYRRGHFKKACFFLEEYMTILPSVKDNLIFEVVGLHLKAALKRATGDLNGLKDALTAALSKAEHIEPGRVTATVYAFAATVTDLITLEEPTNNKTSSKVFSIRALEHSQHIEDCSRFHADKVQKVHITLATFYLGCNLSGEFLRDTIVSSDLHKAKASLMNVHKSTSDGNPLSWYREVQFKLVQSIYCYRHSQVRPDERVDFLHSAFEYVKKAECVARHFQFVEMVEWIKANKALYTERVVHAKLLECNLRFISYP